MTRDNMGVNKSTIIMHLCSNTHSFFDFIKKYPICVISVTLSFVFSLLAFNFVDCITDTTWTLSIWDALFDGRILEYAEVTAENMRGAPNPGDTGGFLQLLPWAIWNFPLWITHLSPDNYSVNNPVCIIWSKLFLIICLFLTSYFVMKLSYNITNDQTASDYGFILCFTAGTAIMTVGYAGQNEIIYITTFLASVYCSIEGHKLLSTCLMVYSLGCFPVLVLPFLIILLLERQGIVKSFIIACSEFILGVVICSIGGSSSGTVDIIPQYIDRFFYSTSIISANGALSLFGIVAILIILYCMFKNNERDKDASIICLTIFFTSMLLFSQLSYYRYFVCVPAIILSLMILFNRNRNLFNISLILFVIINFATSIVACRDGWCWSYKFFTGFLSNYFSYNSDSLNFLWELFGENTTKYVDLILSGLFATCLLLIYILIKKPTDCNEVKVREKTVVTISAMCPLFLVLAFLLVPIVL